MSTPPPPPPPPPPPLPLLIALSGPTSSGKTTISHVLASLFPSSLTLIHADDFYKPDSAIPLHPSGVQDWDCADALDLPRFRQTLLHVRGGAAVPAEWVKQADGVTGPTDNGPSEALVEKMRREVDTWPESVVVKGGTRTKTRTRTRTRRRIVLVEGFLLFGAGVQDAIGSLFDVKILLRAKRATAQERRQARNGYVTLEGFWRDPEGYFEHVVWPNYQREYACLFEGGDVEGAVRKDVVTEEGNVMVGPVDDVGLEVVCEWVLGCLKRGLYGKGD